MIIAINSIDYEIYTFSGLQRFISITSIIADDPAVQKASATLQCSYVS